MRRVLIRPVHGSGRVDFGPNLNSTYRCWVEDRGTQNWPPKSISWVDFGWGWASIGSVGRQNLKKVIEICKKCRWNLHLIVEIYILLRGFASFCCWNLHFFWLKIAGLWPDLAKSHKICLVFVDLAWFFIWLRSGSRCSDFGEANPPLDLLILENGNPPLTDWTFGLGRN